jgi:hypothetical protein
MTDNEINSVISLLTDTDDLLQTLEECRCKTTGRISVPSQEEFDYISDIREYIKEFLNRVPEKPVKRKFLIETEEFPDTDLDCTGCCLDNMGFSCSGFCTDETCFKFKTISEVIENDRNG